LSRLPGTKKVLIVKNGGTPQEQRIGAEATIQPKKGFFAAVGGRPIGGTLFSYFGPRPSFIASSRQGRPSWPETLSHPLLGL
jgi:hypothetical protein